MSAAKALAELTSNHTVSSHDASCDHQNTQFAVVPGKGAKSHHLHRAFTAVPQIGAVPIGDRLTVVEPGQERLEKFLKNDGVVLSFNADGNIVEQRRYPCSHPGAPCGTLYYADGSPAACRGGERGEGGE